MSGNVILKANDLYKSYTTGKESFEALRGVSLSMEQGEMLAGKRQIGCSRRWELLKRKRMPSRSHQVDSVSGLPVAIARALITETKLLSVLDYLKKV